jgi:uncharacterized protein YlxW (UPF0749 family)
MAGFRHEVREHTGRPAGRTVSAGLAAIGQAIGGVRSGTRSLGTIGLSLALLLGGVAAGVLISTQWQLQGVVATPGSSSITRQAERGIVDSTIRRLESEQADLKKQIADLRGQLNDFQTTDAQQKSTLQDINKELETARVASGMLPLHGPGVVFTLDDSPDTNIPPNEDPARYIIHDYDLRDVLSTLWAAGAEAVSINGERIVGNTSLYCVGTTIIVNSTRLSPPYVVRAIGDPETLEGSLKGAPQMAKLNERATIYDIPATTERQMDLLVPAYNGSISFKYAEGEK